ncbi:MAG: dTDP-glucose 4,6-dehydratase [Gammaproteobacteria bacterium]|nr:dTDP-glucose 4,6-dehydratase [Gammaproteobacteria bacterium]MDH4254090.1 dTDP-glucose 4,6-dehydratase [Gammaproteobacteria bacterium]MDH5309638.1 dTDP-glucose 4,6-dehydratase [Gammaproteobacteria bacterium]
MTILVTGGAGFIGANFVLSCLRAGEEPVVNLDKLTYAGNLGSLAAASANPRHLFVKGDICDLELVSDLLRQHAVRAIVHFAAESHVDRSIRGPEDFIRTNITGTFRLLEATRSYVATLPAAAREAFRFVNVSTDEVFGSLGPDAIPFDETSGYFPNSPYSASKAAGDHLVRSYFHTYGLPVITTHCSNNYGPFQFPEKLIPLVILRGQKGESLPVYGDGMNVRDWLYVEDHCEALRAVLAGGKPGATYNIGGDCEKANLDVVHEVCALLDELHPLPGEKAHRELVRFVADRPGHDRRYAIDAGKIRRELGWRPAEDFRSGIRKTVVWYLQNQDWVNDVSSGEYRNWLATNYGSGVDAQ